MDQNHNGSPLSSLENVPMTESLAAVSSALQENRSPIPSVTDPNVLSTSSSDKESTIERESSSAEKEEEDYVGRLTTDPFMPSLR